MIKCFPGKEKREGVSAVRNRIKDRTGRPFRFSVLKKEKGIFLKT